MTENGCSLEDCHTNLFALTDLTGIKWQRLSSQTDLCTFDPTEDPVLISYSKCIQSDILCVWRRQPRTEKPTDQILSNPKELWIFWYGQDPPVNLASLISTELSDTEFGSWENGLTYECRTLLFKALHNLIERCLVSHNFVRVGKWFVHPYSQNHYEARSKLSISFLFFLHGDSTVCASIDVRQHPPLYTLHPSNLLSASHLSHGVQVLLAPYGMSGMLTGRSFLETDHKVQKILEDWRRFFCFPRIDNCSLESGKELPPAVEVIVAGMKLCYPSNFVFLTEETLGFLSKHHSNFCDGLVFESNSAMHSYSSLETTFPNGGLLSDISSQHRLTDGQEKLFVKNDITNKKAVAKRLIEKVWQDNTLASGLISNSRQYVDISESDNSKNEELPAVMWSYADPMQRNPCICTRNRNLKTKSGSGGVLNKQQCSFHSVGRPSKTEKADKERSRYLQRSYAPYHRRSISHDVEGSLLEMDFSLPQNLSSNGIKILNATGETLIHCSRPLGSITHGCTVDSPHSGVPSPLISSQTQPSVNQNCDPTMPTLSPHPLPSKAERDIIVGAKNKDCQDLNASTGSSTISSMSHSVLEYEAVKSLQCIANEKLLLDAQASSVYSSAIVDECTDVEDPTVKVSLAMKNMKKETLKTWQDEQREKLAKFPSSQRPVLPFLFEDEEVNDGRNENRLSDTLPESIMDQPIKQMRQEDRFEMPSSSNSPVFEAATSFLFRSSVRPVIKDLPSPSMQLSEDPYQFSDEADSGLKNMNLHAVRVGIRDEGFSSKPSSFSIRQDESFRGRDFEGNYNDLNDLRSSLDFSPSPTSKAEQTTKLMREDDLIPKIQDLEKMFDTDEDCDADSPTSPNYIEGPNGETITSSLLKISASLGVIAPSICPSIQGPSSKDLSRMFPTPPSADNPLSEPMQDAEFLNDTPLPLSSADHSNNQFSYNNSCLLPKEEVIKHSVTSGTIIHKECPFVYEVPTSAAFPAATVYDPIDLPSNHAELSTIGSNPVYTSSYFHLHPGDRRGQPFSNSQCFSRHSLKAHPSFGGFSVSRNAVAPVESSPALFNLPPGQPMSYESPASTSSSCFTKNLNSLENTNSVGNQATEVSSLAVNILLTDSILNIFKDLNFDSCTICVCNTNIDGNDVGLYLPDRRKEELYRCHCAFSAIVNRRHGLYSGLFYEDEDDITGYPHGDRDSHKRSCLHSSRWTAVSNDHQTSNKSLPLSKDEMEQKSEDIMILLKDQFSTLFPSCAVASNCYSLNQPEYDELRPKWGSLEFIDGQEACYAALEYSRIMTAEICNQSHVDKSSACLHKWPYVHSVSKFPANSQDVVRLLKSLQPLLQDALQKKRTTKLWESVYNISGPLSWKDFHLMAGRGSEETSEPKPVPHILVGFAKEWMSVSPLAIRYWDKLMLEPYSESRNILYCIVSPDNDYILNKASLFIRELGVMYEQCRLGEHKPLTEKHHDNVLRVGKTNANLVAGEPVDDWFNDIGNSPIAAKLRLYSQVCRKLLVTLISQHLQEKILASEESCIKPMQYQYFQQHQSQSEVTSFPTCSLSSSVTVTPSSSNPGDHHGTYFDNSAESFYGQQQQDMDSDHQEGSFLSFTGSMRNNSENSEAPFVVLYFIEPFTYGQKDADLSRLAMFGILRCFNELLKSLPEQMQSRIQLQVIPQQVLLDFSNMTGSQFLKKICFSVYANCHRVLAKTVPGRSLTGFGTAASAEKFLVEHKSNHDFSSVQLYTPPFVLAPNLVVSLSGDTWCETIDRSGVLFCAYCLSEDQRWLLVSCTDNSGEMLETCCINVEVSNRKHRKKPLVALAGLTKLWDFIIGVLSNTNQPWRVVIGRFGRLGHGELQAWSNILNRKNLLRSSQLLRKHCKMCTILQSSQIPCILSACLVSMELHPSIHIMIDAIKREENQSSKCQMSTPRDASVTHILVFPTSASARSHDPSFNLHENPMELADDELFIGSFDPEEIGEDIDGDINDFIDFPFASNSPKAHTPGGSPANDGKHFFGNELNREHSASIACEQDEVNNQHLLLQQPLAMGFYVSTAPTGPLPKWFWSSCPERENFCPACFKAALHIHCSSVQQNQDDPLHQPHQVHHSKLSHPLDSNVTTDVLRHVLESYNQLSWLTMDPVISDRRSCLPIHILVLMQLYHGVDHYV